MQIIFLQKQIHKQILISKQLKYTKYEIEIYYILHIGAWQFAGNANKFSSYKTIAMCTA